LAQNPAPTGLRWIRACRQRKTGERLLPYFQAMIKKTRHAEQYAHCRCAETLPPRPQTGTFLRRSPIIARTKDARMMDPKSTALVLIEFQNDFTSEGGSLHAGVKTVMQATSMLENTVRLVEAARALGVQVAFLPITFTDDYHELTAAPYGILKGVVDTRSFRKGSWGAEIVDCLKPQPQDLLIEGKRGLCGFASTNLDFILRSRGIANIALAGFLTNCCVEATARTAYEKGYRVVTLKDCTATLSLEEQNFTVEKNFPMFSLPASADEFLSELRAGTSGEHLASAAA